MKSEIESILTKYRGKLSICSCTKNELTNLLEFDHHVVKINGEKGVLITYHLIGTKMECDFYEVIVVHEYVISHPSVPDHVNQIVDKMDWERK